MIRWIQVPSEGKKNQVTTLEIPVQYIIICKSAAIETHVLFSVIKFGTAKTCFSMPKDKNMKYLK